MTRRLTDSFLPYLAVPALGVFALVATISSALWHHDPDRVRLLVTSLVSLGQAIATVTIHVVRQWHDLLGNLV